MKNNDKLTVGQAILGVMCILLFFLIMGIVGWYETHYSMQGKVVEVNKDFVVIEDITQNQWMVDNDDNLNMHDKVKIKFDNNFTDGTRTDDIITEVELIVK